MRSWLKSLAVVQIPGRRGINPTVQRGAIVNRLVGFLVGYESKAHKYWKERNGPSHFADIVLGIFTHTYIF